MSCWRIAGRYSVGQASFIWFLCADTVAFFDIDPEFPGSVGVEVDGNKAPRIFQNYLERDSVSARPHTPKADDDSLLGCANCPCPPGHCNIKCDRAANGYCCISHNFINGLIKQLP